MSADVNAFAESMVMLWNGCCLLMRLAVLMVCLAGAWLAGRDRIWSMMVKMTSRQDHRDLPTVASAPFV
jgi:hypothetical protein